MSLNTSSTNSDDVSKERTTKKSTHGFDRHPLLEYDPRALECIDLIELEYFESEDTKAPVPRNQDLPSHAKAKLTERSILVSTSHAWFYQSHPDPNGVKLKLIKNVFAPQLRKRYPYTKIVVFDDWHSCPQWPRKDDAEEARFRKAMHHMNSMYVYCDVVLFLEAELPELDMTVRTCTLIPSQYDWSFFIDIVQFQSSSSSDLEIQKSDIVTSIITNNNKDTNPTVTKLKNLKTLTSISFLRRPFGRPNCTPADERGWLFAERITIAIRAAAAPLSQFDDVVVSNSETLRNEIYKWSELLRDASKREKKNPGSIARVLHEYEILLTTKRFTWPDNEKLVIEIMNNLVEKFKENWETEVSRQSSMSTRAREILLRWGEFSEDYVDRARLLCNTDPTPSLTLARFFTIAIVAPSIAVLPVVIDFEGNPDQNVLITAIWFVCILGTLAVLINAPLKYEFASIPYSIHNIYDFFYILISHGILVYVLRILFNVSVLPFECLIIVALGILFMNKFFLSIKCTKTKDPRTGKEVRIPLKDVIDLPRSLRFSDKARMGEKRLLGLVHASYGFGFCKY